MRRIWSALALFAVATTAFSQAAGADSKQTDPKVSKEQKTEVLGRMTKIITQSAFVPGVDFSKWTEFIEKEKDAIDKAQTENEFVGAVNNALEKFGFSHIVMSTPQAAKMRRERKMVGMGVRIEVEPEGIRIVDLIPDAPAIKAGIEIGDLIIEADGKKPTNTSSFAGEEGTSIKLKVKKQSGDVKDLEVVRRPFSLAIPESLKWVEPGIALVKIPSFDMGYSFSKVDEIMKEAAGAKMMIVDLRSNGGGAVFNLLHLANYLFPSNTALGTFINRSSVDSYVKEQKGDPKDLQKIADFVKFKVRTNSKSKPYAGPITVLINGGSGSASEILAAALKEVRGAQVIGSKSAGAVLASIITQLPYEYQLQFPITDYLTIKGVRLEGNGVKPDIEAAFPRKSTDADKGVEAAVKWFVDSGKKSGN